jgi:hypothetical protein
MSTAVDAVHVTWVNLRLGLRNHKCRFKIQNSTVALPPTVSGGARFAFILAGGHCAILHGHSFYLNRMSK